MIGSDVTSCDAPSHQWLIVGADGLLGSAVVARLLRAGIVPWQTTRRVPTAGSRRFIWEMGQPFPLRDLRDNENAIAVIGVGDGSIRELEVASPDVLTGIESSWRRLISELRGAGFRVVTFSTNLVFNDHVDFPDESELTCPTTNYGRLKRVIEEEVLCERSGPRGVVLRLTKTLGRHWSLIDEWRRELQSGREIHPISEMVCAPLPADFVADVVYHVASHPEIDLLHVSPSCDVSYVDVALRLAKRLGVAESRVVPRELSTTGLTKEMAPTRTALNSHRLLNVLGLRPPDVWETLRRYLEES